MKILQINSGLEINGAVTYNLLLNRHLLNQGHNVGVLCRPKSWMSSQIEPEVSVYETKMKRNWFELRRVAAWIKEQKFDVLHTHMTSAHSFGVLLRFITGLPVVATAHSTTIQLHWRFNNFVIANSKATYDYHLRYNRISKKKMSCIYCCTELNRFIAVSSLDKSELRKDLNLTTEQYTKVISIVGEVTERKGQDLIIKALPKLATKFGSVKLLLAGPFETKDSYYHGLQEEILRLGLQNHVSFLGRRSDIPEIMRASDLVLVPSTVEPLGLVAMEAMATGTPVIASAVGGLKEIIEDGVTGRLVKPNIECFTTAVDEVLSDPDTAKAMADAAKEEVLKFQPDILLGEVEQILNRVCC